MSGSSVKGNPGKVSRSRAGSESEPEGMPCGSFHCTFVGSQFRSNETPLCRLVLKVVCLLLVKTHYNNLFGYLVHFNPPQS